MVRRARAQSLTEAIVGVVIFVPVVLVLLDMSLIYLSVQQNETLCRNAAEAAASGDPVEATKRAELLVQRQNESTFASRMSHYELVQPVDVKMTSFPQAKEDLATEEIFNPGGPITGTVTASTAVDVKTLVVHLVRPRDSKMRFKTEHSFPIKYIMPSQRKPKAAGSVD